MQYVYIIELVHKDHSEIPAVYTSEAKAREHCKGYLQDSLKILSDSGLHGELWIQESDSYISLKDGDECLQYFALRKRNLYS